MHIIIAMPLKLFTILVIHSKYSNINLINLYYANFIHFSILQKMNSKVQKWILFNV